MNKFFASIILMMFSITSVKANSFDIISSKGKIISFDTIKIFVPPNAELVHFDAHLFNGYQGSKKIKVRRTNLDTLAGTQNYFCWVSCYSPLVDTDPGDNYIVVNGLDTSTTQLIAYYKPFGKQGSTKIKYAFYDVDGNVDDVSVVLEIITKLPTNPIILQATDDFVTNSDTYVTAETDTINNAISEMVYPLSIINNTNIIKNILIKKRELKVVDGSENYFSWYATFNPSIMEDTVGFIMLPHTTLSDEFKVIYRPNGKLGESVIQYVAYNKYDLKDSSYINVHFNLSYSGLKKNDNDLVQLNAFPNPATSFTTLNFNKVLSNTVRSLSVINVLGKVVAQYKISNTQNQQKIETSNFENGIYFCRLTDGNAVERTIKIVVTN